MKIYTKPNILLPRIAVAGQIRPLHAGVALWLFCFFFGILALAASPSPAAESDIFSNAATDAVLIKRTAALASQREDLRAEAQSLNAMATGLNDEVALAQNSLRGLLALYRLSRSHPTEMLSIVQQLQALQSHLNKLLTPVRLISTTSQATVQELTTLREELSGQEQNGVQTELFSRYTAELSQTLTQARHLQNSASRLAAQGEALSARIAQTIDTVSAELPSVWKAFYFTDSGSPFSLELWQHLPLALADWVKALPARMAFAWPQDANAWGMAGLRVLLTGVPLLLVGLWLGHLARQLPGRWGDACREACRKLWPWVALGWALVLAASNRNGGFYLLFAAVGVLFLIRGIMGLAWRLRRAALPGVSGRSPLAPLFPPTALGILFLYTDLPPQLLGAVWMLAMLGLMLHAGRMARTRAPGRGRTLMRVAVLVGAASVVCTLFGYTRLAIPVFMLFFALAVFFELGNSLMRLAVLLADARWNKRDEPLRNGVFRTLFKPLGWIAATICLLPWLWALPGARYLISYTSSIERNLGEASFSFSRILWIIALFFVIRILAELARIGLKHLPDYVPTLERGVVPPLQTLARYLFWVVFFLLALAALGVNLTSLAVVAGGLSVGVGIGLQNLFGNLVSGLMLLFGRTVLVGDVVQLGDTWGEVKRIGTRSTELKTYEHASIHVPNSDLLNSRLINWSRENRLIRRSIQVGVAYGSDVELVMRSLLDIAGKHGHVLENPAPSVVFNDFGASTLDFALRVHIDDVDNIEPTCTELRLAIERRFREAGIEIAFPQLDVHLRRDDAADISAQTNAPEREA